MDATTASIATPLFRALSPLNLLLTLLYGEARGEAIEGQVAVANVILHRLDTGRWGTDIRTVILAPHQFSCMWPELGGPDYGATLAFAGRCYDLNNLSRTELQLRLVAEGALRPALVDNVGGATHYFDKSIAAPAWAAAPAVQTATIGRFHFFRNVR